MVVWSEDVNTIPNIILCIVVEVDRSIEKNHRRRIIYTE